MARRRTPIEQELHNRREIARTLIRLKHRLAAGDEINNAMEGVEETFHKGVQKGVLPPGAASAVKDLVDKVTK